MTRTVTNFTKGVITGAVVGAAAGVMVSAAVRPESSFKKNTDKAMKAVGHFVDNVSGAMGTNK